MKLVVVPPEIRPTMVKVLELLSQYDKPESDLGKYHVYSGSRSKKRVNIKRDYGIVAKKCLASHRFPAAATMLDIMCQELNMDDIFFLKAASIVLENNPATTDEEFFFFMRYAVGLAHINKRELVLECLIRSFREENLESDHVIEVPHQRKHVLRNVVIDSLLTAYSGMNDYLKWAQSCQGGVPELCAKQFADAAVEAFRNAVEVPGQWDIFIFKLVEMLELYGAKEEIEAVLRKYAELNPEHINSHIYLCWYLNKYKPGSDELKKCLKGLANLCPSDSRVLLLVELLKDTQPTKALKLLFTFLDYPSNADIVEAWTLLLDMLVSVLESQTSSLLQTINSYWRNRWDVWSYIHFNPKSVEIFNKKSGKHILIKTAVLSVFVKHHPYMNAVIEKLPQISKTLFKRLIEKISYIEYLKEKSSSEASDSDSVNDMDVT